MRKLTAILVLFAFACSPQIDGVRAMNDALPLCEHYFAGRHPRPEGQILPGGITPLEQAQTLGLSVPEAGKAGWQVLEGPRLNHVDGMLPTGRFAAFGKEMPWGRVEVGINIVACHVWIFMNGNERERLASWPILEEASTWVAKTYPDARLVEDHKRETFGKGMSAFEISSWVTDDGLRISVVTGVEGGKPVGSASVKFLYLPRRDR